MKDMVVNILVIACLLVIPLVCVACIDDAIGREVRNGSTLWGNGIILEKVDTEMCMENCPFPPVYKLRVGDNVFALHSELEREPGEMVLVEFGVRWTNDLMTEAESGEAFEILMIRIVE